MEDSSTSVSVMVRQGVLGRTAPPGPARLSLNRPRILQGKGEETSVQVPESGKPDAVKVARPVWNGGKAARPYLSLREVQLSRK